MTNKSIEQWRESNETLSNKNAYYVTQSAKVKKRLATMKKDMEDQERGHQAAMLELKRELMAETALHNQTRHDFDVLSTLKMRELLDIVAPFEGL